MQMIDVLKRLAELDATNPNVAKPTMTTEQSLISVSNAETEQISESIAECGPMGMSSMDKPSTPATFSINATASTGDEVSSMLKDIMNLAGIKSGDMDHDGDHDIDDHGIELSKPSMAEPADDMPALIGMIDKMNGPEADADGEKSSDDAESPVAKMADEVRGMTSELAQETGAEYDNTPEPEIEPHKYGDDQVTPKPQGLKQRLGDNPYKPVGESTEAIEQVSLQLLKAYEEFKKQ